MIHHRRVVDVVVGVPLLVAAAPIVGGLWVLAARDTGASGFFRQERIGRYGRPFVAVKIRTMTASNVRSTITVRGDARVTPLGARLRRMKLDEVPQLWNVVTGRMSLVGPRPDVRGYADQLVGDDRIILDVRPGITGPASIVFRDEELLLAGQADPAKFNDMVIWPAKVAINRAFVRNAGLVDDLRLLGLTIWSNRRAMAGMLERWDPTLLDVDVIASQLQVVPPARASARRFVSPWRRPG